MSLRMDIRMIHMEKTTGIPEFDIAMLERALEAISSGDLKFVERKDGAAKPFKVPRGVKLLYQPHNHDATLETAFLLEGRALFHADGEWLRLSKGEAVATLPGVSHLECPDEDSSPYTMLWLVATRAEFFILISTYGSGRWRSGHLSSGVGGGNCESLWRVAREWRPAERLCAARLQAFLTLCVADAIELLRSSPPKEDARESVVRRTRNFMDESFHREDLDLESIAAAMHYSPSHLRATFKSVTGKSIHQYLTERRMEEAERLLKSRERFVGDVALSVGYKDQLYFSKLFKRLKGVSPSELTKPHTGKGLSRQ